MKKDYLYLTGMVILTSIISVSAHVLILQYFKPPELLINLHSNLLNVSNYLIRFGTVIASMFIYIYSKEYWMSLKPVTRIILFALLMMALTESLFRGLIMGVIAGIPWMFQTLITIPSYIVYLCLSLIICTVVQAASEKKHFRFLMYTVLAVLTTILLYCGIKKIVSYSLMPLLSHVPQPQESGNQLPYGYDILIPAYITYLEPTIASFIVFYLIENKLSGFSTITKGLIMAGILFTIHAGIFSLLQIAYSTGSLCYRAFYYGQFIWEYLTLGLLTAYSFEFFRKIKTNPS